MSVHGRILALDVGHRRIGVAVSDALGITAQARGMIKCKAADEDMRAIAEHVRQEGAVRVVVGLPINMDGSTGPAARKILSFVQALKDRLSIPVVTWDERLSTREAESVLIEANISRKKRKGKVDALAALIILQAYLDAKRSQSHVSTDEA